MRGERITPRVDLSKIDRVPVSIVAPVSDQKCPVEFAEWIYDQITSEEKYIRIEGSNHYSTILN